MYQWMKQINYYEDPLLCCLCMRAMCVGSSLAINLYVLTTSCGCMYLPLCLAMHFNIFKSSSCASRSCCKPFQMEWLSSLATTSARLLQRNLGSKGAIVGIEVWHLIHQTPNHVSYSSTMHIIFSRPSLALTPMNFVRCSNCSKPWFTTSY